RVCGLDTLADLFDVSRSTLWNAINDVLPILDNRRITITPAEYRHATPTDLLASVQPSAADQETENRQVVL
ncbi:hypothetical protein, partial [Micromonospora sp. KC207]|uniref:hypothetical protein n=1 Tax=Micromonospora sp. KC207 TaxID=2530377 RepID=UPI0014045E3C